MTLADFIDQGINFNLLLNKSYSFSDEKQKTKNGFTCYVEGLGVQKLNIPLSPKLTYLMHENYDINQLVNFLNSFNLKKPRYEENDFYEFETDFHGSLVYASKRVYKTDLELIKSKVLEYIEEQIKIEKDLLIDQFNNSLKDMTKTAVSFQDLKTSYLTKWNEFLQKKTIYYSPEELSTYQNTYGGVPLANDYKNGSRYWIDEISNAFENNGATLLPMYCTSNSTKVVSTVAIRRAIQWLKSEKEQSSKSKEVKVHNLNYEILRHELIDFISFTNEDQEIQILKDFMENKTNPIGKINWRSTWKNLYSFCYYFDSEFPKEVGRFQKYGLKISKYFTLKGKGITPLNAGKQLSSLIFPKQANPIFQEIKKKLGTNS